MSGERHVMPNTKVKLLIVDDEPAIRATLSSIFTKCGHSVRSAQDGFSALAELRAELPDILLSDLHMPGMSGFELLSVVRRRFPAIQVIAMSGAFSGDSVPLGVAADAFHQKGSSPRALVAVVGAMAEMQRTSMQHPNTAAPVWIPENGHNPAGDRYVMVTCPECLRVFPHVLDVEVRPIRQAGCAHCSSVIHYAIVEPPGASSQQLLQRSRAVTPPPTSSRVNPAACE